MKLISLALAAVLISGSIAAQTLGGRAPPA